MAVRPCAPPLSWPSFPLSGFVAVLISAPGFDAMQSGDLGAVVSRKGLGSRRSTWHPTVIDLLAAPLRLGLDSRRPPGHLAVAVIFVA